MEIGPECGPLEKGMANHLVFLPSEPHEQYEKAKRYDTERWTSQGGGAQMQLEKSVEITPEKMKRWSQSENNTQV